MNARSSTNLTVDNIPFQDSEARGDTKSDYSSGETASKRRQSEERIKRLRHEAEAREHEIGRRVSALATIRAELEEEERHRKELLTIEMSREDLQLPAEFTSEKRKRTNSIAWVVRENAYKILRTIGRPMNSAELLDELTALGIELKGEKPAKAINKILWNAKDRFDHVETGYWIAGMPQPATTGKPTRRRKKNVS